MFSDPFNECIQAVTHSGFAGYFTAMDWLAIGAFSAGVQLLGFVLVRRFRK